MPSIDSGKTLNNVPNVVLYLGASFR